MTLEAFKLPAELVVRAPVLDDAPGVLDLINTVEIENSGKPDTSLEELREDWQDGRTNLETDARVVTAVDGKIVGYEIVSHTRQNGRVNTDGFVHPDFRERGIGTALLRFAEQRAQEFAARYPEDVQVVVQAGIYMQEEAGRELLIHEGFATVRHFWRMEIDMDTPPLAPHWPQGISVRTFAREQDEYDTYATIEEAFEDHWGHTRSTFEDWSARVFERENFDPALVFLAIDDHSGEVAGVSLCRVRMEHYAWLGTLAVRRPWRGRGLAKALLYHTFSEFYGRGFRTVGLGVDAQSLTNATRLYEKVGMHIAERYDLLEKELRSGRPLYTTSL